MENTTATETTVELPMTLASAQCLACELRDGAVTPHEVAGRFVEVMRDAKLEAGDVTFDELVARMGSIRAKSTVYRAKSTVCRAMSPGNPQISRWRVIQAILERGLNAGPDTVKAVREAWVAAKKAESRGTHRAYG